MIKKIVNKRRLDDPSSIKEELACWLGMTSEQRLSAVEFLRIQSYGSATRLQRVARIIKRAQS